MATFKLDVVTAERVVYSDDVDMVVAPGVEGQLGILPHHAPLMTMLQPGELLVKKGTEESCIAITGGYLEVRPDRVVVLADAAERAEDIDVCRAEEAMKRAQQRLKERPTGLDATRAEAALRRAFIRLQTVEKAKQRRARLHRK
ncbi:MAG: F0F1 ATP synthase subunit epsilon [Chloroflexi bacterium]|nr:F0F1 ATP synthase subunit epsilon [Chloroflexota bacterium]